MITFDIWFVATAKFCDVTCRLACDIISHWIACVLRMHMCVSSLVCHYNEYRFTTVVVAVMVEWWCDLAAVLLRLWLCCAATKKEKLIFFFQRGKSSWFVTQRIKMGLNLISSSIPVIKVFRTNPKTDVPNMCTCVNHCTFYNYITLHPCERNKLAKGFLSINYLNY